MECTEKAEKSVKLFRFRSRGTAAAEIANYSSSFRSDFGSATATLENTARAGTYHIEFKTDLRLGRMGRRAVRGSSRHRPRATHWTSASPRPSAGTCRGTSCTPPSLNRCLPFY